MISFKNLKIQPEMFKRWNGDAHFFNFNYSFAFACLCDAFPANCNSAPLDESQEGQAMVTDEKNHEKAKRLHFLGRNTDNHLARFAFSIQHFAFLFAR